MEWLKKYGWMVAVGVCVLAAAIVLIVDHSRREAAEEEQGEPLLMYEIPYENYTLIEDEVARNETMGVIFERFGIGPGGTYRIEQVCKRDSFDLRSIGEGNHYVAFLERDSVRMEEFAALDSIVPDSLVPRRLAHFVYVKSLTDYVVISLPTRDSVVVRHGRKPVRVERLRATAEITSSMWNAIIGGGYPAMLSMELEDIYGWSVDFFGIQKGDSFDVIYEQKFVDSIPAGMGRIWGAVFHHGGKQHYAIPFKQDGKIAYWDENGNSLKKQFLKAPLNYSRISSRFSNARMHPILKIYRPHHAVDYAAPSGTPVCAVADGVVTRRGWDSGGGGNMVWVKHARGYETGYLHLRSFGKGIVVGARVGQGQQIGEVGSTGRSTGPHLDYRIRVNGKPIDPLKIPQEPGIPVKKENRETFAVVRDKVLGELSGSLAPSEWLTQLDSIAIPDTPPAPINPSPVDTTRNVIDGPR